MKATISIFLPIILILFGIFVYNNRSSTSIEIDHQGIVDTLVDSGVITASSKLDEELLKKRTIILTKEVNQYSAKKIIASLLLLDAESQEEEIDLYIRTDGGWYTDAFAIADVINNLKAPVNTIAMGNASSSGAIILAAGTGKRQAYPNAIIMVHTNVTDYEEEFDWDTLNFKRFLKFWKNHSSVPEEWIHRKKDESYYLSAEEALEYEIIDHIISKE